MSPSINTENGPRAWYDHALVRVFLTPFIVPIVMAALSVWASQGQTAAKIEAVETRQQATDARVEANRLQREQKFEELRREVVTKELFDAKWKTVERMDKNIDKLLDFQLEARGRK